MHLTEKIAGVYCKGFWAAKAVPPAGDPQSLGVKEYMTDSLISVKDFAGENALLKQTVFKVIKRLGIKPEKSRGGSQNRGQTISYLNFARNTPFGANRPSICPEPIVVCFYPNFYPKKVFKKYP
jgi:hypothetical protein